MSGKYEIRNGRNELLDPGGRFYKSIKPSNGSVRFSNVLDDRIGSYGVEVRGDQKFSKRGIKINYDIVSKTDAQFRSEMNKIMHFFSNPTEDRPYYLIDTDNNIRCEVIPDGNESNSLEGLLFRIAKNGVLDFIMVKSLWETAPENFSQTLSALDTFQFPIHPQSYEISPTIEIVTSGINDDFSLDVGMIDGMTFIPRSSTRFQESGFFEATDKIVIDSQKGIIFFTKAGVTIRKNRILTGGTFIKISPRYNIIRFSGVSPITISGSFRSRLFI